MSMNQLTRRIDKLLKVKKSEDNEPIVYEITYDEETDITWQTRVFVHGGQRVILCMPEMDDK